MNDPVLLELFTQLRESGLPLGVAEYHLLLRAIDGGFGIRDRDDLAQLCRSLWVKSPSEEQIFQDCFDQIIPLQLEKIEKSKVEKSFSSTETVVAGNRISTFSSAITSSSTLSLFPRLKLRLTRRAAQMIAVGLGLMLSTVAVSIVCWGEKGGIRPLFQKNNQSDTGRLIFDRCAFFPIVISENMEEVEITIVRIGGRKGTLSATLVIEDDLFDPGTIDDTPREIFFQNGQARENIKILLVDDQYNNGTRTVSLRLTDSNGGTTNIGGRDEIPLRIYDDETTGNTIIRVLEIGSSVSAAGILLFVFLRMRSLRKSGLSQSAPHPEITAPNLSRKALSPEVVQTIGNETISYSADKRTKHHSDERFPLSVKHLPITRRQMKQGWRHLRQLSREGPPSELDLDATVQQVSKQGSLLRPVLVSPRLNCVELLLLIDMEGSMVPFHHLAQALIETAHRGGRFRRVRAYYFHNCPDEYLHRDPYQVEAEPIDECLARVHETRTVCIIFSDGGAARGRLSSKRRRMTKFFLKELCTYVRYTAWLNPFPRERWVNTTAQAIAELVPMFELTHQDFCRALDVLRGRYSRHKGKATQLKR